jgi:multidrug resistance efflux pump
MKILPHGLLMLFGVGAASALVFANVMTTEKLPGIELHPLQISQEALPDITLAAPGRIEGRDKPVYLGAGADGVISAVFAHEGDEVKKGAVLAEIDCRDLAASLTAAKAEAGSAREAKVRLMRGSRLAERRMSEQKTLAAKAVLDRAAAEFKRHQALYTAGVEPKATFDQAQQSVQVASADYNEAVKNEQLVKDPPLPEDVGKADDDIAAADAKVKSISDQLSKCFVTAPIDGTILRILLKPGESFSTLIPSPVLSMDDLSVRHVRADVDERDILKVWKGQRAIVFSPELPQHKFFGKVVRVASEMGRPTVVTGDPSDKADRDVLEAIVDLGNRAQALPIGLRVTVQFLGQ